MLERNPSLPSVASLRRLSRTLMPTEANVHHQNSLREARPFEGHILFQKRRNASGKGSRNTACSAALAAVAVGSGILVVAVGGTWTVSVGVRSAGRR